MSVTVCVQVLLCCGTLSSKKPALQHSFLPPSSPPTCQELYPTPVVPHLLYLSPPIPTHSYTLLASPCSSKLYSLISVIGSCSMIHVTCCGIGGRTSAEIVNWLMKKTGPPAVDLTDPEAAKKFAEKDEVVLIGFFKDVETKEASAYLSVAEVQDRLAFGITSSQEVADAMEATFDSVILYKKVRESISHIPPPPPPPPHTHTLTTTCLSSKLIFIFSFPLPPSSPSPSPSLPQFDEGKVVYTGELIAEEIDTFIRQEQLPLVTVFSDEVGVVSHHTTDVITTHLHRRHK